MSKGLAREYERIVNDMGWTMEELACLVGVHGVYAKHGRSVSPEQMARANFLVTNHRDEILAEYAK